MNLTDRADVSLRAVLGESDGVPLIGTVAWQTDVPCAVTSVSAAELQQLWGSRYVETPADYAREHAHLYLPAWLGRLPEAGRKLSDYRVDTHDGLDEWQLEAVRNDKDFQIILIWRNT